MNQADLNKNGDRIVKRPRLRDIQPTSIVLNKTRKPQRIFSPTLLLFYGFIILILIGSITLMLPISSNDQSYTHFEDAIFTATSAITVTGLTVVSTTDHWSSFGKGVIFVLMLVGGIGFMSFATFILIVIGQRITLSERILIRDSVGGEKLGGIVGLLRRIFIVVIVIYGIGMVLIFWQMIQIFPLKEAVWQSAFLSVSGFNNAGFTILPDSNSLEGVNNNVTILITVTILILLGGIGWSVIVDTYKSRRFSRFTLDTKLITTASISLWVFGALILLLSEFANPLTLGEMPIHEKVSQSLFHSISGRTAGFAAMPMIGINELTKLLLITLMFIGGAAGSVAGGIKIGTFAVIVAAVVSSLKGRLQVEAFGREIPQYQVLRAITIGILGLVLIILVSVSLTLVESDKGFPFLDLLFETVSAFGTAGLSMGVAPLLTIWGKMMLTGIMILGRIGPLAVALALTPREDTPSYRFAQERVRIG
ncbi:Trk family potassium uptake protein [SAR202 cluster bacterium AC-409-J13_OGT_754m]|nr:Trk family potassium uptake protein [SAR202 cluster bacterium AC-409-J13_OGT_754m]